MKSSEIYFASWGMLGISCPARAYLEIVLKAGIRAVPCQWKVSSKLMAG